MTQAWTAKKSLSVSLLSAFPGLISNYTSSDTNSFLFAQDFWDTAGQERFTSMHPSYYHEAHACILVFDATRKITYKNVAQWYKVCKLTLDSFLYETHDNHMTLFLIYQRRNSDSTGPKFRLSWWRTRLTPTTASHRNPLPFPKRTICPSTLFRRPTAPTSSRYKFFRGCAGKLSFSLSLPHLFFLQLWHRQVFTEAIQKAVAYKNNSDDFVDQVLELLHEDSFSESN